MMIYLWQKLSEIIILVPSLDSYTHSFSFMEIQSLSLEKIQSRSGSEKGNKINEPEVLCLSPERICTFRILLLSSWYRALV